MREFLPGPEPSIGRADAYPDLYTEDHVPVLGSLPGRPRTVLATGFSGLGFKIAPASAAAAVAIAAGEPTPGLAAFHPARFAAR